MIIKVALHIGKVYYTIIDRHGKSESLAIIQDDELISIDHDFANNVNISPDSIPLGYTSWVEYFDEYKESVKALEKL